jgi:hypothetical protein
VAHPRVEQLRFARREFARGLAGVTPEVAQRELGQMNSISWMVAHLAWHEQVSWLTRAQKITPFPQLVELGASGGGKANPDFAEVRELWLQVCDLSDPWLDQLTPAGLRAFAGKPFGAVQDVGTALLRMTYHYFVHCGEASAIRQIAEGGSLPEFVGLIQVEAPWRPEPGDDEATIAD